ncbi:MAG: aldehyde ferredoxin oxidoreductase family protein [Candidatus Bathyarchaeia archaeon]
MELKLLDVDLTNGTFKEETVDDHTLRRFVGGRGLGAKLLYERVPKGIDPLGAKNIVFILTGPATGTSFPLSGRHHVIAKSPATGTIGESNSGGNFGAMLRRSGYDGIIVHGISDEPVYLTIMEGEPKLHDANHLWGKGVFYTEEKMREELGEKAKGSVLSIGPAGENLSLIASVMNDKHRAAGRTGLGAVLGSKRLKAIYVKPFTMPEVYDEENFNTVVREKLEIIRGDWVTGRDLTKYGTEVLVNVINGIGAYPTRNFQTGVFPTAEKISGETLAETYLTGNKGCWGCITRCGRLSSVPNPPYQAEEEGPEYESTWAMGANCGIDDLAAIVKADSLCDDMGLDTISYGVTVATAMELYEKGKIPRDKLHGLSLEWGNPQAIVDLAWMTGYRTGFGDDTALGALRLAEKYGMPEAAMQAKGLEFPAYEPRAMQGSGLGYATSNRGGCHLRAYIQCDEAFAPTTAVEKMDPLKTEGKAERVVTLQNFYAASVDSLVVCKFLTFAFSMEDFVDLINPLTGWDWTVDEMLRNGERIYNLERKFSVREGIGTEDTLPRRLLEEPMPEGPAKGYVNKLGPMLEEYYRIRGWVNGVPTKEKLEELGIAD